MRPHIICHMLSAIDGRIDGTTLGALTGSEYETTGAQLKGDAWICGRTTMEMHFAEKKPFVPKSPNAAGAPSVYVAAMAASYAVSVDTLGKLRWRRNEIGEDHLVCVVSERAPKEYLAMLRQRGISYIVTGKRSVNLAKAMELLREHFGVKRALLEGGGHINGAFIQARLVDEVSLLVVPGIDGRAGVPTIFDGIDSSLKKAARLKLASVSKLRNGTLWLRYKVLKNGMK